tara:strand:+ start:7234 stop:7488 length:255 start_codon:yes stop_codon:yes gene_type:complete
MYVLIKAEYLCLHQYTCKWTEYMSNKDYLEMFKDDDKLAEHIGFNQVDEDCGGWTVPYREDRLISCSIQQITSSQYDLLVELGI